jgi:oligoendopeptidase F
MPRQRNLLGLGRLAGLCTALALALSAGAAHAAPETAADRWNLAELYPSTAAWEADAGQLAAQITAFANCKGHLGTSPARLRHCLDLKAEMEKRLLRLQVYSGEQLAQDTGVAESLGLDQKADLLASRLGEAEAFVEPELLHLGARRIGQLVQGDPGLRIYRHALDDVLRRAPHTLDDRGEALAAQFGNLNGTGRSLHGILVGADLPWPRLTLSSGETVTLDQSAYTHHREAASREDRQRVMEAYFSSLKTFERSLGVALYAQLKQESVYSKVRGYPDAITRILDQERMPVAVYDTLIAQVQANLPTLHRYFRLRARMLGVPDMAYHDIYPPLVQGDYTFPIEKARQLVLEAVQPLGPAYGEAFGQGLASRWMDVYPRPRKMSGAHMAGSAYDVHPYVLMNYSGDYESVSTLAHEWGHAMHTVLANRAQPFVNSQYATFVAEIASTFNEALLLKRMLASARTDDERLFYLGRALEQLRATFWRQAMFAEFERKVHAVVDAGEPLTGEQLSKTYCEILRRHHASAEGVVRIDDKICLEWSYIPHFYNAFYVYQYATSIAASSLFADRVAAQEPGALERYLGLLRAGGSDYPYELVKAAGVDLATAAPYQSLVARMNRIMDEIESILARRH